MNDSEIFEKLFELGKNSKDPDGVVVAGLVKDGKIIVASPSADDGIRHAEDLTIAQAKEKNIKIGEDMILYVTVEPCTFRYPEIKVNDCSTIIINSGIKNVVFAIQDPRHQHNSEKKLWEAGVNIRVVEDKEIAEKALELYYKNK